MFRRLKSSSLIQAAVILLTLFAVRSVSEADSQSRTAPERRATALALSPVILA